MVRMIQDGSFPPTVLLLDVGREAGSLRQQKPHLLSLLLRIHFVARWGVLEIVKGNRPSARRIRRCS